MLLNRLLTESLRFLFLAVMAASSYAQVVPPPPQTLVELQEQLKAFHQKNFNPAWAVAVIENGDRVWLEVNGKSNLEQDIDATQSTLFRIGSTSKILVAMAALQLVEQGALKLDTPLRELAPEIEFANPWEATNPVRFEHLIEHTTGWDDMHLKEYAHNDPEAIALRDALALYPGSRQSRWVPGTRHAYCNTGPAVAAYVIQKITGQDFEDYVAEQIFKPLAMQGATFRKPENYDTNAAIAYYQSRLDFWHVLYRPSGSVSASIGGMANLLEMLINNGEFKGQRLLSESSIARMRTPKTTTGYGAGIRTGYAFAHAVKGYGELHIPWYGHDGAIWGAHSYLYYSPRLNSGYVMLTTGRGWASYQAHDLIRGYLSREHTKPDKNTTALPPAYRNLDGFYIPVNPRYESQKLRQQLRGALRVKSFDNGVEISPLFESWVASLHYLDGRFVNPWIGLDDLRLVEDPIAGQLLQLGERSLQRTPAWRLLGLLFIILGVVLSSAAVLIWTMVWVSNAWVDNLWCNRSSVIWYAPAVASFVLLFYMLLHVLGAMSITSLAEPSVLSVSLSASQWLFVVAALSALVIVLRYTRAGFKSINWWLAAAVCVLQISFIGVLYHYGLLFSVSWNN